MRNPSKVILALADFHGDDQFVPLICRFVRKIEPTHIVWLGDIGNWNQVSPYPREVRLAELQGETIPREADSLFENIVAPIIKTTPMNVIHIFMEGNHERRLLDTVRIDPKWGDRYTFRNIVRDWCNRTAANYEYYELNTPWRPSPHLQYLHGIYWNQHHAKKHIEALHKTTIYGHVHDIQKYTAVSPIDKDEQMYAQSIGCLCDRNPDYRRNRPNRWAHGFSLAYVWDRGYFNEYTIQIIKGKFVWNGELFHNGKRKRKERENGK